MITTAGIRASKTTGGTASSQVTHVMEV